MPVQVNYELNDTCVLRISGILKRSEFGAEQTELARKIDIGLKPRLLVILENFEGWERGADWNDLDFMISYGVKFPRSPSSLSHVGKLLRSPLPERESRAGRIVACMLVAAR
jgi:hypothetical protein